MQKISLKDWVVLLTIVPTTLIGIGIASYFSYNRYLELNDFLATRSTSIIEPLALASTEYVKVKDREKLRNLISFAHRNHSDLIKNITIFTSDNQVLVTSTYHGETPIMRLSSAEDIPQGTKYKVFNEFMVFRTPIINEALNNINNDNNTNASEVIGYVAMQVDRSKSKFKQHNEIIIALLIVLIGSGISAYFTFRLIKNVTRPISSMVQAVDRIREGKLESRVSGQLIGELNFLKNGINAMAQSLGDYHDEMQRSIDQATYDLRESLEQFEIQNVELDLAKRKAQEANRVKSEFLANMSHELRTPLNGVIGFTRQLLKTPLSDTQRDHLQTIDRSANNLLTIINDILDFSKLDAGKMSIESIPFTLRDSVEEALILLAPSSHKKNLELSLRISPQIPDALIGDAMRIKQILMNLVNNAIKFTEKGSITIDIDVNYSDNKNISIKFTITDTGIGMSSEEQNNLFEAFNQADKSITRLYGGTGLGLVISQRLANEMQGDIGFHSEEGRGSSFWFTTLCAINPTQLNTRLDDSQLKDKTILYFEPQNHSRTATCELLENWHMKVTPVTSMEELSAVLTHHKFDYALISHEITPAALNELKQLISSLQPQIPSIHIAINSNSPSLQETLLAAGATCCLSKPLTPKRLHKALQPLNLNQLPHEVNKRLPIKVLAVDDNEANLKLIKALLLEQVTDVAVANNGAEALEICNSEKFALIFMDIQMPVMDGITALDRIKHDTFNDNTPIIAVTAHALTGEKEKFINQGFSSYMTKPIDELMLKHIIYEYCDPELFISMPTIDVIENKNMLAESLEVQAISAKPNIIKDIDWELAIKRAGNKADLAADMLLGLVNTLPEAKTNISNALNNNDHEQVAKLIHKLNGACCYCGVPKLANVVAEIETQLKKGEKLENLEPELLECFDHMETILAIAPEFLNATHI